MPARPPAPALSPELSALGCPGLPGGAGAAGWGRGRKPGRAAASARVCPGFARARILPGVRNPAPPDGAGFRVLRPRPARSHAAVVGVRVVAVRRTVRPARLLAFADPSAFADAHGELLEIETEVEVYRVPVAALGDVEVEPAVLGPLVDVVVVDGAEA